MLGILYETPYAQNKATEETCTCSAAQMPTHKLPRNQYEPPAYCKSTRAHTDDRHQVRSNHKPSTFTATMHTLMSQACRNIRETNQHLGFRKHGTSHSHQCCYLHSVNTWDINQLQMHFCSCICILHLCARLLY